MIGETIRNIISKNPQRGSVDHRISVSEINKRLNLKGNRLRIQIDHLVPTRSDTSLLAFNFARMDQILRMSVACILEARVSVLENEGSGQEIL